MKTKIVLVSTQHNGNLGAVARAMKVMGQTQLVLVSPKANPNATEALARASHASDVLTNAIIVDTLVEALVDCDYSFALSARSRDANKPVFNISSAMEKCSAFQGTVAFIFGPENNGLSNDDLQHCHAHVKIPTSPQYSSLNLAAAVQIITYALFNSSERKPSHVRTLAPHAEIEAYLAHLQTELDARDFFKTGNPDLLMNKLRNLYLRAELSSNEVALLRGTISALSKSDRNHHV